MNIKNTLLVAILFTRVIAQATAETITYQNIFFDFDIDKLKKGDISYAAKVLSSDKIKENYPQIVALDAGGILDEKNGKILISKTVYVINKPSSFFNYHQLVDPDYIKHLLKDHKVTVIDENSFHVFKNEKLKFDIYYDSDDINYTKKPHVVNAITESKKLDPLAAGSAASLFEHYTISDSKKTIQSSVINFVSISAKKTLVIIYSMSAAQEKKKDLIKNENLEIFKAQQNQINNF